MQVYDDVFDYVEIDMIRRDTLFFYDLIQKTKSKKGMSILIFGLNPFYALFILESYKYMSLKFDGFEDLAKRKIWISLSLQDIE